jgi:hypothetical protein
MRAFHILLIALFPESGPEVVVAFLICWAYVLKLVWLVFVS